MFRNVTDGAGEPCFMLVCDNIKCDVVARMEIPKDVPGDAVKAQFLGGVMQFGWTISLEGHYCPKHSNAPVKKLIQVAKGMPGIIRN